jgi:hypothetical protein
MRKPDINNLITDKPIPPAMPHAFAAPPDTGANLLILFAPGLRDRFEYFRLADRVLKGQASPQEILANQERFDNYFLDSPEWTRLRVAGTEGLPGPDDHGGSGGFPAPAGSGDSAVVALVASVAAGAGPAGST